MKCYKVTTSDLQSALVYKAENACVQYQVGEYVEAPKLFQKLGLHLFAFETLAQARIFRNCLIGPSAKIWECSGVGLTRDIPPTTWYTCVKAIKTKADYKSWCTSDGTPDGTIMVNKLKLIKQVK